jgi:hypothetical protein
MAGSQTPQLVPHYSGFMKMLAKLTTCLIFFPLYQAITIGKCVIQIL